LSDKDASDPVVIAIDIDEPRLADRLRALLASISGLRLATEGEPAEVSVVLRTRTPADAGSGLTSRELEVLTLLAEGASNKTIARRLGISVHTAKFHVRSLIDKLDASGRTDAVAHAARLGVIHL
jgi:DNA-binding CsgD family transcriptional regulator